MGKLTQTTAQVQKAISNELGKAVLSDDGVTFDLTTSFQTLIPKEGDWTDTLAGSTDFTVSASAGTITCNFDGKIFCYGCGSFSNSTASGQEISGHFFTDAVDSGKGFIRSINSTNYGSFCAPALLTVSDGDVITFRMNTSSGTPTVTLHDIAVMVERVA